MALLFGEYELDEERRQLLRSGRPVSLEPKAYELLTLLAERRPRALSRAQIRDALWPGVFISESTLNQVVAVVRQALDDDHRDPRYIRTAHGFGYAFCGEVRESGTAPATVNGGNGDGDRSAVVAPVSERRSRWRLASIAVLIALVLAAAAGLWLRSRGEPPAPHLVQLTGTRQAMSGSLSPDDRQLAFASTGDQGDNWDIWLTMVGDSEARRLTSDEGTDAFPAWSPDGKQIAFVRSPAREPIGKTPGAIYLVSPMGGPERRLADFLTGGQPSWSPDGRGLAVARRRAEGEHTPESGGIQLLPVGGGEAWALTRPVAPTFDSQPAFSPDGRALAYVSCEVESPMINGCHVYVQPLDRESRPQGPGTRLTREAFSPRGLTWTRDGRSIVYGLWAGTHSRLWRVRADGSGPPERVELAGPGGIVPIAGRSRDRLVFSRIAVHLQIYRLQPGAPERSLIQSTMVDWNPQYSPDGRRIAFQSERADERYEVWLADAEGANITRLTRGPGRAQGAPRWSPDGRTIAFDSQADDGRFDIWTIRVDGSGLRKITRDPGDEQAPSFSRDGRLLYYTSSRAGRFEIWRVPVEGGAEEQVTHEGGLLPFESHDGRTLYYTRNQGMSDGPLLARPTQGGAERIVAPCVALSAYSVSRQGVFYAGCKAADGPAEARQVWLQDADGREREIATLELPPGARGFMGFSASPDGSSIVYAAGGGFTTNVMMLEDFR